MKSPVTRPVSLKLVFLSLVTILSSMVIHTQIARAHEDSAMRFVQIEAIDRNDRSLIADYGVSIEAVRTGSVWGFATPAAIELMKADGITILGNFDMDVARGGHETGFDFPAEDSKFHNFSELTQELTALATANSDIARVTSIGKSLEGRDIWAVQINTTPADLAAGRSNKPGAIFMGNHHAREHLSAEIPLLLIKHLLSNRKDARVGQLLEGRDIWIIPMVNPDGAEWDISTARYKMWRKNRRNNGNGTFGVDLNRNYGYMWGTGGSSANPSDDTFKGPNPFSEPETQVIRDFVNGHLNAKVLLSFHTFSELILYPWGHKNQDIENSRDRAVFETMAKKMATWNGYTPEQASDLYIASGDTTDWAYGEHGIFAFTFELSPRSMWDGGFYPGQAVIDRVFNVNIEPCLYMIDTADDPYKILNGRIGIGTSANGFLNNYLLPAVPR